MAVGRSLVSRRRRDGDDEDEDGTVLVEDSQSEGSVLSDRDEDGDETSEVNNEQKLASQDGPNSTTSKQNGKSKQQSNKKNKSENTEQAITFKSTADTEAMMNGLQIDDRTKDVIDFDAGIESQANQATTRARPSHQKKDHEEYKKKRDADPAFIPNRGNFFMHDTRGHHGAGPLPFRGNQAQRGRGRATPYVNYMEHPSHGKSSEQLWKHDLHESINEEPSAYQSSRHNLPQQSRNNATQSFSSITLLGRVQLRVTLPGMKEPSIYKEVPLKKYIRLPDHRPPLRRDKPVRVFLPSIGPKYIFPSTDRSFIFIPRQMRPNQRGYGNMNQRSIGGYGYSSRRTSMYGGSMYSGSVAPSRRSSIARDRENMFSPGSYASGFQPPSRPVVRLPQQGHFYSATTPPNLPYAGHQTPNGQVHVYPLPQQPAFQGTPTTTVQHPRPQKAISVSGIESPAMLSQRQTPGNQQAFHSQLPMHVVDANQPMQYYPQQYASSAAPSESPLHAAPEYAMQAQQYAPQQQMFYPQYPTNQQPYFYPPVQMPMYMMPQQQQYMMPSNTSAQQLPPPQVNDPAEAASEVVDVAGQVNSGMVAHESNGMVFYMPASEAATQTTTTERYQPAESFVPAYAVPGLPPTPAPEQSGYYYMGMNGGYYPPAQQS